MARIAVGGFHHETSSVTPGLTGFASFTVQRDRPPAHLMRVLAEGRPAGRALRKLPFLIPLHAQCTEARPTSCIIAKTERIEAAARQAGLIGLDYLAGFPPSEIWWCGPSVIAYAATQATARPPYWPIPG